MRGAVVAVTDMCVQKPREPSLSLTSLTMAAVALPGLMMQPACADEGDSVNVLHTHYQEGARDLAGMSSKFQPIQVDTLLGNINFTLANDLKGAITLTQDTWSGATPVATAPLSAHGNRVALSHSHVMTGASIDNSGHIHDPEDGDSAGTLPQATSGASPYLYSSLTLDAQRRPLITDNDGKVTGGVDSRLVHTLSSASPEIRQEIDANFSREFTGSTLGAGAGFSHERDFESVFGHVSGSKDFNQKLTTLSAGLSYTHSNTSALLDHDVVPHIYEPYMLTYERRGDDIYNRTHSSSQLQLGEHAPTLKGQRNDWSLNAGVTQVLNQGALLEANLAYTHSFGYQSNPYKAVEVAFIDPLKQKGQAGGNGAAHYVYDAELVALMEQRPDLRNQTSLSLKYVQHIAATDAALHTGYRYFKDTWGIHAQNVDIEWIQPFGNTWTVSPYVRYYSQNQADFYTPYLITEQGLYSPAADPKQSTIPFDRSKLPSHYSSDPRLSGYGTLATGVAITKYLSKGVNIEFSYEQMQHAGHLKMGGGGEGRYADFNSYLMSIALNIQLDDVRREKDMPMNMEHAEHNHAVHKTHSTPSAPAGVQFDHLLDNSGDFMFSYRFMDTQQGGAIEHNGSSVSDYGLINNACYGRPCYVRPTHMNMRMHMLDLMYAPTDWLTLMLMPQFVDMKMSMRLLNESPRTGGMDAIGSAIMHAEHPHTTSGLGDTELHGLIRLARFDNSELHMGIGVSAPTADVDLKMRPMMGNDLGVMEYGMQLGSGTWDFKPSLTLTGKHESVNWGAQLSGTKRLEGRNASGYALGDVVQSTLWGSYALTESFSASLRGLYTDQQAINGAFSTTQVPISMGDYAKNYGGRFADVGVGVSSTINTGSLAGTHWSVEWLQPVADHPNGYQLERKGTLVFNWGIHL